MEIGKKKVIFFTRRAMLKTVVHPSMDRYFIVIHREGIPKVYSALLVCALVIGGFFIIIYRSYIKRHSKKSDDHRTIC